jgi:phosphoribosylglycinamide formyltransferase 1
VRQPLGYVRCVGRIAVLASGSGTILRSMLDADLPIAVVLADRPCGALGIADEAGVATELVERTTFGTSFDRVAYTHEVLDALARHRIDLIAMAGFGTILSKPIHDAYPDKIVNTHPALLPAFKGWHAVDDALAMGVKVTGCTVHFARLEVDDGPILAQEAVPVLPDDTVDSLHERIKEVERRIYPEVLRALAAEHDAQRPGDA